MVDSGDTEKAHAALVDLLALGPHNVEALKLQAQLFRFEGRFDKEAAAWSKIIDADREDPDAINYYIQKQVEDREFFYFTDALAEGGRLFLAYPRSMITMVMLGLMGCMLFLMTNKLASVYSFFLDPTVLLGCVFFFLVLPWILIVITYFRVLRYVKIASSGLEISTRLKTVTSKWQDIEKCYLAHGQGNSSGNLSLIMLPRDRQAAFIEIDIDPATSSIRALPYFVKEVSKFVTEIVFVARETPQLIEELNNMRGFRF